MAAGLTICCRKCLSQVTLPPADGARPPRWFATRYWLTAVLAELAALAAVAACLFALSRIRPPDGVPLLVADEVSGIPTIAAPGALLAFRWQTGLESAGGHFHVRGHTVTLTGFGQLDPSCVGVRERRWPRAALEAGHAPPMRPVVLEVHVRLPDDEMLGGETVSLRIGVRLDYLGPKRPAAPVAVLTGSVERKWKFTVPTTPQRARYARYQRARAWLRAGAIVFAAAGLAVALGAALLARRTITVQCPKCGRITLATYYPGGTSLHISPCPHQDSRPVPARR